MPIDAPPNGAPGVDPSILAAMQGGFAPQPQGLTAPMQQRMYDAPAPAPMPDQSMLPEPVQAAVRGGFAPQGPPVGVVDGLGMPSNQPQYAPPEMPSQIQQAAQSGFVPQAPPDVNVGYIDNGKFVPATQGSHTTKLDPKDEREFESWVKKNKVPFDPKEANADYDMRGFWQAQKNGDPNAAQALNASDGQMHFPDTYKTPYHATFSDESKYATPYAPSWQGDKLVDRNGNVVANESTPQPSGFVPRPLANPFPGPPTVDSETDARFAAQTGVTHRLDPSNPADAKLIPVWQKINGKVKAESAIAAAAQQKQAAYAATPAGMEETATKTELDANQQESKIAGDQATLEARKQEAEAAIHDKNIADIEALNVAQQKAQADAFAQKKQMLDGYSKEIDEQIKKTVDPNRLYNSQSTARHIATAAGIFIAGLGSGSGENPALKMVSQAIDRDIDAQKADIAKGSEDLKTRKGLIDDYGHLADTQSDQLELRRAQYYKMEGDRIAASASHFNSPKAILAGQQAQAELHAKAGTILAGLADKKQNQLNKDEELKNTRAQIGVAGYNASTERMGLNEKIKEYGDTMADKELARREAHAAKMEEIAAKKGSVPDNSIAIPTGRLVQPPNGEPFAERAAPINGDGKNYEIPKESIKEVQDNWAALQSYRAATNKLRELRAASGGHILASVEGARAALQQQARASLNLHKLGGIKRMSEQSMALADQMMTGSEDPKVVDSYIKSVEPELATSVEDATQDFVFGLPKFNGDPKQFYTPDPLAEKNKAKVSDNSKLLETFESNPKIGPFEFKGSISKKQRSILEDIVKAANVASGWGDTQSRDKYVKQLEAIVGNAATKKADKIAAQYALSQIDGYVPPTKPATETEDPTQNMPSGMGR